MLSGEGRTGIIKRLDKQGSVSSRAIHVVLQIGFRPTSARTPTTADARRRLKKLLKCSSVLCLSPCVLTLLISSKNAVTTSAGIAPGESNRRAPLLNLSIVTVLVELAAQIKDYSTVH